MLLLPIFCGVEGGPCPKLFESDTVTLMSSDGEQSPGGMLMTISHVLTIQEELCGTDIEFEVVYVVLAPSTREEMLITCSMA